MAGMLIDVVGFSGRHSEGSVRPVPIEVFTDSADEHLYVRTKTTWRDDPDEDTKQKVHNDATQNQNIHTLNYTISA